MPNYSFDIWGARVQAILQGRLGTDALLVSACDKLHNARTIATDLRAGHDVYARFNKDAGREGTLWYYGELERIFRGRLRESHPLYREFVTAIAAMGAFELK